MENPELTVERAKATFKVSELTTLIEGSLDDTEERHLIEKIFSDDPVTPDPLLIYSLSPDEIYHQALKTVKYFDNKLKDLDLPGQMLGSPQDVNSLRIRSIAFPHERPTFVHSTMFVMTLMNQSTEEQQKQWLPLVEENKMIGAYAQTELGHGTNLQKLETTATYDPNREEFILNSPTLTSIKCWPGGLGRTSNHTLVMAQLHTNGECHGIHMFLVQLRSYDGHRLLPGITAGELGPKMGVLAMDNGFLRLDNVRIPRENMLMRYSQVLKDGTYVKPQFARSNYGTMVMIRIGILWDCGTLLGESCTIAVRYNAVRRQGTIKDGGPEVKIIDYQTQQEKLFPQVALAYSFYLTYLDVKTFYIETVSLGDSSKLNEIHALVAGLKGLCTTLVCPAVETCRRACGGLGYLQASGIPMLYALAVATTAYEGDNTILLLQTARFLVKSMRLVQDGEEVGTTVEYLTGRHLSPGRKSCMQEFLQIFEKTSARMIKEVTEKLTDAVNRGMKQEIAWQEHTIVLTRCGFIHSQVFVIKSLHNLLCHTELSNELSQILEQLFQLLAIQWLLQNSYEFILYGGLTEQKLREFNSRIPKLLVSLRPNIVPLVDAFDFCDASLHTAIGCYDGRVYERLYDYWTKLPANKQQIAHRSSLLKANL